MEWRYIAKMNLVKNRLTSYLGGANFIMLLKIFFDSFSNKTLGYSLLIAGAIGLLILGYIDYKYILPHELNIQYQQGGLIKDVKHD